MLVRHICPERIKQSVAKCHYTATLTRLDTLAAKTVLESLFREVAVQELPFRSWARDHFEGLSTPSRSSWL